MNWYLLPSSSLFFLSSSNVTNHFDVREIYPLWNVDDFDYYHNGMKASSWLDINILPRNFAPNIF